jgi:hypothetical protein
MGGNRQQLAVRLQRAERALQEAQRGLDGTEGARMRYLAARVEHAEAEREAVGVLLLGEPTPRHFFDFQRTRPETGLLATPPVLPCSALLRMRRGAHGQ